MKMTQALVFISAFFAFNAGAGGPADKATGEFTLSNGAHRLLSAHESIGKLAQKGFLFSWTDDGLWFEIDFNDTFNTCVNVYDNGHARIGGLVSAGTAPQLGRHFGFLLVDGGEPGVAVDHGFTYRVSTDRWSEEARLGLLEWCESGLLAGLPNEAIWPYVVTDGNFQVHDSPLDFD